jgi:hypothetical protein
MNGASQCIAVLITDEAMREGLFGLFLFVVALILVIAVRR